MIIILTTTLSLIYYMISDGEKRQNSHEMRTAALKQTLCALPRLAGPTLLSTERRCQSSFSMSLYRPFPTQPSSPFSRSRPVCLFLLADGCPYFSLYPLRTQSPSRLETLLSLSLSFCLFPLSRAIYFFFPHILLYLLLLSSFSFSYIFVCLLLLHLLRTQLFHLFLGQMPPARCNVTFIVPFSPFPLVFFLDLCSISLFPSFSPLLNIRHSAISR